VYRAQHFMALAVLCPVHAYLRAACPDGLQQRAQHTQRALRKRQVRSQSRRKDGLLAELCSVAGREGGPQLHPGQPYRYLALVMDPGPRRRHGSNYHDGGQ
jgi:hypothetical protein